jgi:hypothetical protein
MVSLGKCKKLNKKNFLTLNKVLIKNEKGGWVLIFIGNIFNLIWFLYDLEISFDPENIVVKQIKSLTPPTKKAFERKLSVFINSFINFPEK